MARNEVNLVITAEDLARGVIGGTTRDLRTLEAQGGRTTASFSSMATSAKGFLSTLTRIGFAAIGLQAITTAVSGLGRAIFGANIDLERFELQFETLLGSVDEARDRLGELVEFGLKTPFELPEVVEASRQLQIFGGDVLATGDSLRTIGDAAAATGQGFQAVAFWTGRLNSMLKNNQPAGEALLRLQEMALVSGELRIEIEQLVKSGEGLAAFDLFMASMESSFGGGMDRLAASVGGAASNIADGIFKMRAAFFGGLFEDIRPLVQGFSDFLSSDGFLTSMERWGLVLADAISGVGSVVGDIGGDLIIVLETISPALTFVAETALGLGAALEALTPAVAAVVAAFTVREIVAWGSALAQVSAIARQQGAPGMALLRQQTLETGKAFVTSARNQAIFGAGLLGLSQAVDNTAASIGLMTAGATALGFAFGGPLGAGVAGSVTLLTQLTKAFGDTRTEAEKLETAVNDVTEALRLQRLAQAFDETTTLIDQIKRVVQARQDEILTTRELNEEWGDLSLGARDLTQAEISALTAGRAATDVRVAEEQALRILSAALQGEEIDLKRVNEATRILNLTDEDIVKLLPEFADGLGDVREELVAIIPPIGAVEAALDRLKMGFREVSIETAIAASFTERMVDGQLTAVLSFERLQQNILDQQQARREAMFLVGLGQGIGNTGFDMSGALGRPGSAFEFPDTATGGAARIVEDLTPIQQALEFLDNEAQTASVTLGDLIDDIGRYAMAAEIAGDTTLASFINAISRMPLTVDEASDALGSLLQRFGELEKVDLEKLTQEAIASVDFLGDALVTALQREQEAIRDAAIAAIDAQVFLARNLADTRIEEAERARDAEIASLEATRDAAVKALEAQLDVVRDEGTAEQKAALERRLRIAFDARDRADIQKQLRELERRERQTAIRDEISDIKTAAIDEIQAVKNRFIEQKETEEAALAQSLAVLEAQRVFAENTYSRMTDDFFLQSQVRELLMNNEQEEMIDILESFFPEWEIAGFTFGQMLIDGLIRSGVLDFITGIGVPGGGTAFPSGGSGGSGGGGGSDGGGGTNQANMTPPPGVIDLGGGFWLWPDGSITRPDGSIFKEPGDSGPGAGGGAAGPDSITGSSTGDVFLDGNKVGVIMSRRNTQAAFEVGVKVD